MSWLYSRALVEAFSEANFLGGKPSALSSGSPIPQAYLSPDRTTAFSRLSRFGMTFAPLTETLGADVLTWCLGVSPARTSASQERAQESTEPARECGSTWPESLARFDLASSSWRTPQLSLLEDLAECLETWPRSGLMLRGECYPLLTLERTTAGSESGSWPTPTASGFEVADIPGLLARRERMAEKHGNNGFGLTLNQAVKIAMYPTPTSVSGNQVGRLDEWGGSRSREKMRSLVSSEELTGSLNPTWVEWLMGWPLGWTDLKPLATAKSPNALPQPSESSLLTSEAA